MTRSDSKWWILLWEFENMLYGGDACWQIDHRILPRGMVMPHETGER